MQVLEKEEEAKFTRWLKKNKIKFKKKAYGELLDRWILLPYGHLLIIELKRKNGGALSKRQEIEITALRELGYDVEVCYGGEAAMQAVIARLEAPRLPEEGD